MKTFDEHRYYFCTVTFWTILGLILGFVLYKTPVTDSLLLSEFVTGGLFYVISLFVTPIILARRA